MTKQENRKAEVLLGRRCQFSDGTPMVLQFGQRYWETTYTLVVNGKYDCGAKGGMPSEVAIDFARRLKEYGISDYALVNGERMRFTNGKRVEVSPMRKEDFDEFKETLEAKLSE